LLSAVENKISLANVLKELLTEVNKIVFDKRKKHFSVEIFSKTLPSNFS